MTHIKSRCHAEEGRLRQVRRILRYDCMGAAAGATQEAGRRPRLESILHTADQRRRFEQLASRQELCERDMREETREGEGEGAQPRPSRVPQVDEEKLLELFVYYICENGRFHAREPNKLSSARVINPQTSTLPWRF